MANRPYEQDNGVLSTVLGTTALAGLGYASYYAVTDSKGFEQNLTKIFNKAFPMSTERPNAFQSRNIAANRSVVEGETYASAARTNSYARAAMRRHTMAGAFEVASGIDPDAAAAAYARTSDIGAYDFTEWSHTKGGFAEEGRLVKAVNGVTGGRGNKYSFNGTTMEFDMGGKKPIQLHIPKMNDELGVWLAKENGSTMKVHRAFTAAYKKVGDQFVKTSERNPIEQVARTLESPLRMLEVLNRDIDTNGYDLRKINTLIGQNEEYVNGTIAQKQKVINETVRALKKDKALFNPNYKTNFTELSQNELQDVFDYTTTEQARYVAHDEVTRMQFFGNQGKIEDFSRIIAEDNFQQIGVNNLDGMATTGKDIQKFYGNVLKDLGYEDGGWFLNQDMTQKGVFSTVSPHTAIGQSEQFKGISKGIRFHDNRAAEKTALGRTAPLIRNPDARNAPKYFINDEPVLNLLSVFDPTIASETLLLNQQVGNSLAVETSKTYGLRKMAGKAKGVTENTAALDIRWASNKVQTFNSLDDFYKHVQKKDLNIEKAVKKIGFGRSTVLGFNNGNDIINSASEIPMAQMLGETGNPVVTHTGGFISPQNTAKGYRSWLKNQANEGRSMVQITATMVEDAKKISETTTKLRGSVSLLDPSHSMVVSANQVDDMKPIRPLKIQKKLNNLEGWFDNWRGNRYGYEDRERQHSISQFLDYYKKVKNGEMRGKTQVDAYQSWNWFKGTIMKGDQVGKNAPEYLSFLQHSILGHIAYGKNDLTLRVGDEAMRSFEKMAHIPEGVKTAAVNGVISVKSLLNNPEFRMLQHSDGYGEQVIEGQRFLASLRTGVAYRGRIVSHAESTKTLNELFDVFEEVKEKGLKAPRLADISGDKAFAYLASYVGNETTSSALGIGNNRFAFGIKEANLLKDSPGILRELSMYNSVNTNAIFKNGERTLSSIAREFNPAKEGIQILNSENAQDLVGKGVDWLEENVSNLGTPDVRMSTMFGDKNISPNGIAVRVREADDTIGTRFIAPSEFWGVNHYIGDKDMITKGEDMMVAGELVRDALGRGGPDAIASKEAREKFDDTIKDIHTQWGKRGFTRTGAIQVETATYDSNVVTHSTLGNETLMKNLENSGETSAKDLRYIMGNSVFQSDRLYRETMQAKIEHMDASRGSKSLLEHVKGAFGHESAIAKAMTLHNGDIDKTVSQLSQNSLELSKRMTQAAHDLTHKDKLLAEDIENIKQLVHDIKSNADVGLFLRDPVLYPHSAVGAFTFAVEATQIAQDKMLSGGDIISTLMNMDNDGDKIKQFMLLDAKARQEAMKGIYEEQKVSYSTLTAMKKGSLAKPVGHWIDGKGGVFRAVEQGEAGKYETAVKSLGETEGAVAAYALKALTGSVDVRTHGLVSHILTDAKKRGFNPGETRELELFVGNTLPLTLVQDSISSKHIARSIENADSRLLGMLKNVGGITENDFKANLRASGGDIDVLSFMTITNKLKSSERTDAWVEKNVGHLDTLLAASRNYRTVNEEEYSAATQWIGYTKKEAETGWAKLAQAKVDALAKGEDIRPLFERGGAVEKYGYIGFKQFAEGSGTRELKKLQMEFNRLSRLSNQGQSESEIAVDALRSVMKGFGERAGTSKDILLGVDLASKRSILGWETTKNLIKDHMTPTRAIGLAGLAMVGATALNMVFGDATPQSPNDLPSVNNPSFRDNRYNNMLENKYLNNVPNANISSGLLTDSNNSYDSIMSHLQSSFGNHYSSVSVRHDGQDPYKEQMMRYNM